MRAKDLLTQDSDAWHVFEDPDECRELIRKLVAP